jgi:signal transduction histidine kinase
MHDPHRLSREEELLARLDWLIRLRWLFLLGLSLMTAVTGLLLEIVLPYREILGMGGFILAYNIALSLYRSLFTMNRLPDFRATRIEANLQIGMDLLALTAIIHLSGGAENPFIFFYLFHAIIGSILLNRIEVWTYGSLAYILFLLVVGLEYLGILPHHPLSPLFTFSLHRNVFFLLGVSTALLITLFGTIYISTSIAHSLRTREMDLLQTRKSLQEKTQRLEEANRELQQKQAQLVLSEKLASLGRLSVGVAHEINNPIQFIQGNMRILDESMGDILPLLDQHAADHPEFHVARLDYPFFRQHVMTLLTDMTSGAARIATIVRDLKRFARLDEGGADERVDLNEVVRASLRLVQNKIKRYRVVEDLDPKLPAVSGSTSKLEQIVIANLINAIEALGGQPDGMITIRTRGEDGGSGVCLMISDNGPGMTEEVKRCIFDPFFTTKQRSGGTGLGLSICYGIVEEHRGQVDVESAPGQGTTFAYHLPTSRKAR